MNDAENDRAKERIRRLVERDIAGGLRRFREREPAILTRLGPPAASRRARARFAARSLAAAALLGLVALAGSIWILRGGRAPVAPLSPIGAALVELPGIRALVAAGDAPALADRAGERIAPGGPLAEIFGRIAASAPPAAASPDLARLEATPRLGLEMTFKILFEDRAVERALRRYGRQG